MTSISQSAAAVELYIGGQWVDITEDVHGPSGIAIARETRTVASDMQPTRCSLTLMDGTGPDGARTPGQYSTRNPLSPYYGLLGTNTPIRYVERVASDDFTRSASSSWGTSTSGHPWTQDGGTAANYSVSSNAGKMTLSTASAPHEMVLGSVTTGGFAASFTINSSQVATGATIQAALTWNRIDANNNYLAVITFSHTVGVNTAVGRRVGGVVTAFSPSALMSSVSYTASTVFRVDVAVGASFAHVTVTDVADATRYHTSVVHLDGPTLTAAGPIGLRALRNVGNTNVNPVITFDDLAVVDPRFTGEVPSWPASWDTTNADVRVSVDAGGITRRLSQGAQALRSPLFRYLSSRVGAGYWPLEDGSSATVGASATSGVPQLNGSGVTFGSAPEGFGGTSGALTLSDTGSFLASGRATSGNGNGFTAIWFMYIPAWPASLTQIMTVRASGSARRWRFTLGPTTFVTTAFQGDSAVLDTVSTGLGGGTVPAWYFCQLQALKNGANTDWSFWFAQVGTVGVGGHSGSFAGTPGVGLAFEQVGDPLLGSPSYAHLAIANSGVGVSDVAMLTAVGGPLITADAASGFTGEFAGERFIRLCDEEGVPARVIGDAFEGTQTMGPQAATTLLDLLQQCADVDQGLLYEPRDVIGLTYVTHLSLRGQTPTATLSYAGRQMSLPFAPEDGDAYLRNDVTVTRTSGGSTGSSARSTLTTGRLGTQPPPNGAGTYPLTPSVNAETDGQLAGIAGWLRHLGTVDETRWPAIAVKLHSDAVTPAIAASVGALDPGDVLTMTDLPAGVAPDDASVMVQGITETRGDFARDFQFKTAPASAWDVFTVESTDGPGHNRGRADTDGSDLGAAATSAATSLTVVTTTGPIWTTSVGAGFDIFVGGERMTVTAIASAVTDAFTRSTSNGWGTATSGQAWTVTGTASEYSVTGTLGRQALVSINDLHLAHLDTLSTDHTATIAATVPVVPTGAPITLRLGGRLVDVSNHYGCQVSIATTGVVTLQLVEVVLGVGAVISSLVLPDSHSAGNTWNLAISCIGATIGVKAWKSTSVEPGGYLLTADDTSLTAGTRIGVMSRRDTSNTNGSQNVDFDNLSAPNPQTFTVTRSVNTVVKAQAAGTAVNLFRPAAYSM